MPHIVHEICGAALSAYGMAPATLALVAIVYLRVAHDTRVACCSRRTRLVIECHLRLVPPRARELHRAHMMWFVSQSMCVHAKSRMRAHACARARSRARAHTHTHTHMSVCVHTHEHACAHAHTSKLNTRRPKPEARRHAPIRPVAHTLRPHALRPSAERLTHWRGGEHQRT